MVFVGMSTGALAGTPIGGVFIRDPTVANFRHLILFSVRCVGALLYTLTLYSSTLDHLYSTSLPCKLRLGC
jgi:hypothetical protein